MEQAQEWQHIADWMGVLSDLDGAAAVLEWDRETGMPEGGAAARGAQLSTLAALRHRHLLDPALGEPLAAIAQSSDPWQAASARIALRDRARASRVPEDLVRALAEASSH
ncbi:MAG: carboxypeptidase M32, partial [Miltoncostaeaceae bacterium]